MSPFRSRSTLAALTVTGLSLLAACSEQPQALPLSQGPGVNDGLRVMAGPPEAPQTLEQLGFHTAQLSDKGTPLYLSGAMPAAVKDGDSAANLVLRNLSGAYRLAAGTTLETLSASTDEGGRHYVKLRQLHRGVPVDGAEIVVQSDPDGAVAAVLGELQPDLRIDLEAPRLDGAAAIGRALDGLKAEGRTLVHEAPALLIATAEGAASPRLAYRALVEYVNAGGLQLEELIVGAADGEVLARRTHIYHALNRSLYDLAGKCIGLGAMLPGALKRAEGAAATADRAINDVYDQQSSTYWFYWHLFGRDSYDDKGAAYKATVHVQFPAGGFSCSPNNAAWLAAPYFQMAYGDGDNVILKDLTLGLDVTAHEITHAVTSNSSNLVYSGESGALNEAMSDIMGSGVEAWVTAGGGSGGSPATFSASADTWLLGKEVAGPMLKGALRFMDNPTKDDQSKDYYPERYTGSGDNGGVHLNSGIPNLVHVLLTDGGKHPRGKTAIEVKGIGLEKALRIFYLTNNKLLTSTSNFQAARYATAQAAETLYGRCSAEWINTHRAWDAVGANGFWLPCNRPPRF